MTILVLAVTAWGQEKKINKTPLHLNIKVFITSSTSNVQPSLPPRPWSWWNIQDFANPRSLVNLLCYNKRTCLHLNSLTRYLLHIIAEYSTFAKHLCRSFFTRLLGINKTPDIWILVYDICQTAIDNCSTSSYFTFWYQKNFKILITSTFSSKEDYTHRHTHAHSYKANTQCSTSSPPSCFSSLSSSPPMPPPQLIPRATTSRPCPSLQPFLQAMPSAHLAPPPAQTQAPPAAHETQPV